MKPVFRKFLADTVCFVHWGVVIAWFFGFWLLIKEKIGGEIYRFFYAGIPLSQLIFHGCPLTRLEAYLRKIDDRFYEGPVTKIFRILFRKSSQSKVVQVTGSIFTWSFSLFGFYLALTRS